MKIEKSTLLSFTLLIIIASLYRVIPDRPLGFAPQIAMALFGGAVIKDKKMSFLLPLLSMFISDLIFEVLFRNNLFIYGGFYKGQLLNYVLFAGITIIGFFIRKEKIWSIAGGALIGATTYFLLSNFADWAGGGLDINSIPYPKTFAGLFKCYTAAIPFYKGSLYATLFFSGILFGGYYLAEKFGFRKTIVA